MDDIQAFSLMTAIKSNIQNRRKICTWARRKRKKNLVTVLDNNRLDLVRYWDLTFYDDLKFEKSIRRGSEGACEVELIDER
jgi:hypothetical protein